MRAFFVNAVSWTSALMVGLWAGVSFFALGLGLPLLFSLAGAPAVMAGLIMISGERQLEKLSANRDELIELRGCRRALEEIDALERFSFQERIEELEAQVEQSIRDKRVGFLIMDILAVVGTAQLAFGAQFLTWIST